MTPKPNRCVSVARRIWQVGDRVRILNSQEHHGNLGRIYCLPPPRNPNWLYTVNLEQPLGEYDCTFCRYDQLQPVERARRLEFAAVGIELAADDTPRPGTRFDWHQGPPGAWGFLEVIKARWCACAEVPDAIERPELVNAYPSDGQPPPQWPAPSFPHLHLVGRTFHRLGRSGMVYPGPVRWSANAWRLIHWPETSLVILAQPLALEGPVAAAHYGEGRWPCE